MSDIFSESKLTFILCVWLFFVIMFIWALVRGKFVSMQARRIQLIFFLCCIAFTFWIIFGNHRVALFVKYICLIAEAHLFYVLLKDVKADHSLVSLQQTVSIAIGVGLVGFGIYDLFNVSFG